MKKNKNFMPQTNKKEGFDTGKCEYIWLKIPKFYGKITLKIALNLLLDTITELLQEYKHLHHKDTRFDNLLQIYNEALSIKIALIGE